LTLPLAIAADGVMVRFCPQRQTPKGKTKWHEIKIPVLDFFHATGQLWRATTALFDDPRSAQAMASAIPNSERFCDISAISRNIKNHKPQLL